MKKLICVIASLVMALSLAACGGKETASVSTDGSTSMQKVINALGEAFTEDTGANFTYNATGSGTGLGLSIVKHAAAYHKAEITLESTPGRGTTITIQF